MKVENGVTFVTREEAKELSLEQSWRFLTKELRELHKKYPTGKMEFTVNDQRAVVDLDAVTQAAVKSYMERDDEAISGLNSMLLDLDYTIGRAKDLMRRVDGINQPR